MKRFGWTLTTLAAATLGTLGLAGCDSPPGGEGGPAAPAAPAAGGNDEGQDHDHDHADVGPHGGHIVELGDENYHAELVHDDAGGIVAVYILDGKLENAVPIDAAEVTLNLVIEGQPKQFELAANPQEGEPAGRSSRFETQDDEALTALQGDATGRLSVVIDGTPYQGQIDHHEHAHGEGHEHDEHEHAHEE